MKATFRITYVFLSKLVLIAAVLVIGMSQGFAQGGENNLAVDGSVKVAKGRLEGATVTLIQDGKTVNKTITGKNGRFDFTLDFGFDYLIEFSKAGYVAKRLSVNTKNVPAEDASFGFEFGGFQVELFKEMEGLDVSILDKPIGKVYFDSDLGNFDYDREHTRSMKEKLDKLQKDIARKLKEAEQQEKSREQDYLLAIADAERSLEEKDYLMAQDHFEAASNIKPSEKYPKDQLKKIEALVKADQEKDEKYSKALTTAEKAFTSKKYAEAKTNYELALEVKPDEKYPKNKLAEVNKIIAEQANANTAEAEKDKQYTDLIAKADNSFDIKKYEEAKKFYQEAKAIKSQEEHPGKRIAEIDRIAAELAKNKEAEQAKKSEYDKLISTGDEALKNEDYEGAKKKYELAQAIFASEAYPKDKISEIDKLLADRQKETASKEALENQYAGLLVSGDNAFDAENYSIAKADYKEALRLKPKEKYPKERMDAIDKLVAEKAKESENAKKQQELDTRYNEQIAKADKAYDAEDYEGAKTAYEAASKVKPDENYPKERIKAIETLIAQLADKEKLEENYKRLIASADKSFAGKKYEEARTNFKTAAGLKPGETYPKEKLSEIETILAELAEKEAGEAKAKELQARYKNLITEADKAYKSQSYDQARSQYLEAAEVKSEESYPNEQVAKIDELLSEQSAKEKELAAERELEEKYKTALSKGDASFEAGEFNQAIDAYGAALALKPGEKYPKEQQEKAKDKLKELAAKEAENAEAEKVNAEYDNLIASADKLFDAGEYENARSPYQEAKKLKPSERYPVDKLKAIDEAIESRGQLAETQKKYDAFIAQGDGAFGAKDYVNARKAYKSATEVKEDEAYPKEKLREIDALLGDLAAQEAAEKERLERSKQTEARYKELITTADNQVKSGMLEKALASFKEAQSVKEDETYPGERIAALELLMSEQVRKEEADRKARADKETLDARYTGIVREADRLFREEKLEESKKQYEEALALKPDEAFPASRIKLIDERIAREEQEKVDKEYRQFIADGDKSFSQKELEAAKASYTSALGLKPEEAYPISRIRKIDEILASQETVSGDGSGTDEGSGRTVTEEVTTEGNTTVTIRTVVQNGRSDEYKMVVHNWGGKYYFKNGSTVSEFTWNKESKK